MIADRACSNGIERPVIMYSKPVRPQRISWSLSVNRAPSSFAFTSASHDGSSDTQTLLQYLGPWSPFPSTTEIGKTKMLARDVLDPLKDLKHSYFDHGSIPEELEAAKKIKDEKLRRLTKEDRSCYRSELEILRDYINAMSAWVEEIEREEG
jgi:hypothetical protein